MHLGQLLGGIVAVLTLSFGVYTLNLQTNDRFSTQLASVQFDLTAWHTAAQAQAQKRDTLITVLQVEHGQIAKTLGLLKSDTGIADSVANLTQMIESLHSRITILETQAEGHAKLQPEMRIVADTPESVQSWRPRPFEADQRHYNAVMKQHAAWDCGKPAPKRRMKTEQCNHDPDYSKMVKTVYCSKAADNGSSLVPLPWTQQRGLVALTTIPPRITHPGFCRPFESILKAHPTWPVYLILPVKPARADLGDFPLVPPQWMVDLLEATPSEVSRFRVIRVPTDRGPTSKLLSIVDVLGDALLPDDMIVTIDDDRFYKEKMLKVIIESSLAHPYAIVSHGGTLSSGPAKKLGVLMVPPQIIGKEWHSPGFGNRLQGFGGVLYRRKFIDPKWFEVEAAGKECIFEDDTWFSLMAYYSGVPIFIPGQGPGVDSPFAIKQDMKTGLSDQKGAMHRMSKVVTCENFVLNMKKGVEAVTPKWINMTGVV